MSNDDEDHEWGEAGHENENKDVKTIIGLASCGIQRKACGFQTSERPGFKFQPMNEFLNLSDPVFSSPKSGQKF